MLKLSQSSAEAELYAIIKGIGQMIGLKNILRDMGIDYEGEMRIFTDASAAVGICQRRGMGKMRRIGTGILWVQDDFFKNCLKG